MASIWTQGPGTPAKKLEGHISNPLKLRQRLARWTQKLAKANNARIVHSEPLEVHLQWPDGARFTVFAELASPPSAPEEGQPKLAGTRGIALRHGTAHVLEIPK